MDRCDYILEEPLKKYPGDFYIDRTVARKFVLKVQELNYGCHDLEPFFYEKSKLARNMIQTAGVVVENKVSQKWRDKWYELPQRNSLGYVGRSKASRVSCLLSKRRQQYSITKRGGNI